MSRALVKALVELERVDALPLLAIEPGMIVADRFCVIGELSQELDGGWAALVTDLRRELGQGPHHRLQLFYLPTPVAAQARLRTAIASDAQVQPRACAVMPLGDGLAVLAEARASSLIGPLSDDDARSLALALCGLMLRLQRLGLVGLQIEPRDLRRFQRDFGLASYAHLRGLGGDQARALAALVELLHDLAGEALAEALDPAPASALELWERLQGPGPCEGLHWSTVLPPVAPFVARPQPLRQVDQALARARTARPTLLVLEGERGIGKSRLLEQLLWDCREQGKALPLTGDFSENPRGRGAEGGGLARALASLIAERRRLPDHEQQGLQQRMRVGVDPLGGVVLRFVPELQELIGEVDEPPPIALGEEMVRHAAMVADALLAIGTPQRPLMLLLDNLQDADQGSIAVLDHLLSRSGTHHTLVVATTRGDLPPALAEVAQRVALDPLTEAALRWLVEAALPGPVAEPATLAGELHARSGGGPLAAWALLQHWVDEGIVGRRQPAGPWQLLRRYASGPAAVHELFGHRLARLDADQRWLALLAALRAGGARSEWLEQVAGWGCERFAAALDGLVRGAILLVDHDDPDGRLRFTHDTARQLVLDGAAPEQQRALHARLARWLREQHGPSSAAQRAHHLELATGHQDEDPALAELHLCAGQEMLDLYELDRARWYFERARARCSAQPVQARAHEGLADTAALAGQVPDAVACYDRAVILTEPLPAKLQLATKALYALQWRSANREAQQIANRALVAANEPLRQSRLGRLGSLVWALVKLPLPSLRRADLRSALCSLYAQLIVVMFVSDPLATVTSVLRARRLARWLRTGAAAQAVAVWASLWGALGWYGLARRAFARAARIARRASDHWSLGLVHHWQGQVVELPAGRYEDGLQLLDRAVASFRRTGDLSVAAVSIGFKAVHGQDHEPAATLFQWINQAEDAAERQGVALHLNFPRALRLAIRARCGDSVLAEVQQLAARLDSAGVMHPDDLVAHSCLIQALARLGQPELACVEAERALARLRPGPAPGVFFEIHAAAASAALDCGCRTSSQRDLLARSMTALRRAARRVRWLQPARDLLEGRLALRAGDRPRARKHLGRVIARARKHGQRYLVLRAHELLAGPGLASVQAAAAHRAAAAELAAALQLHARHHHAARPPTGPVPRGSEPEPTVAVALEPTVARLAAGLAAALDGQPLELEVADAQTSVACATADLELVVTNLVLTARDARAGDGPLRLRAFGRAVEAEDATRLPGGRVGSFVVLELPLGVWSGLGPSRVAGMRACRSAVLRAGGFLELRVEQLGAVLRAYLPSGAAPGSQLGAARAAVLHDDARVRETVAAAVSRLGLPCLEGDATAVLDEVSGLRVIFAAPELAAAAADHGLAPVLVLPRGQDRPAGTGTGTDRPDRPVLSVPFTLEELQSLLPRED